jgi:hypothetical protein
MSKTYTVELSDNEIKFIKESMLAWFKCDSGLIASIVHCNVLIKLDNKKESKQWKPCGHYIKN